MRQSDENQLTRSWVDWTARQIHDPVWRLRYLRSVAPALPRISRWKSRITIGLLALAVLGLVAAPLSLRTPGAANAASPASPPLPAPLSVHRVEPEADRKST